MNHTILIAGAGGIGRAVGLLLANYPGVHATIYIGDQSKKHADDAAQWIKEGRNHPIEVIGFELPTSGTAAFDHIGSAGGVILDCLPGSEAPRMAGFAIKHQMHYANLTEYVDETEQIMQMCESATTGFVLQTGLAPGFINLLGRQIYEQFAKEYQVEQVDHIKMRVGAITDHTFGPHYYGFTWSPIGVATEYIKQSLVIQDNELVWKDALTDREQIIIDGNLYEADLTSGGAADLPQSFHGIAKNLDYKTIRYPGHFDWVQGIIQSTQAQDKPIKALEDAMLSVVPAVDDDLIVIYASVSARDRYGVLRSKERSYHVRPIEIGGKKLRAIQSTTAAPLAECARLLLEGHWTGVVQQSQIDTQMFMSGPFVEKIYARSKRVAESALSV